MVVTYRIATTSPHRVTYSDKVDVDSCVSWTVWGIQRNSGFHDDEVTRPADLLQQGNVELVSNDNSTFFTLETSKIARQLFEISEYADGWMDGQGARFDKASLVKISRLFERNYPVSLTLPTMFPSLEGTILAQWHLSNGSAVLEIELPSFCGELNIFHRDIKQIEEEDLNLEVDADWIRLSDCIAKLGE